MSTKVPTTDMIVLTSMIELESLFGPSFDEYFNGENQVVSKPSAVTTADASVTPPNWVAVEYGSGACYFMDQQHKR
ncbi:hypothetical protein Tco_0423535, partial [Tanacetum coccineum]